MFPGYELGLATKILQLNVEDHVTVYKLMIRRWGHTIHQDVESNTHILHLLLNGVTQKSCASGLVNGICLLDCLGNFNPVLVSAFVVSSALALNQVPFIEQSDLVGWICHFLDYQQTNPSNLFSTAISTQYKFKLIKFNHVN